MSCSTEPTQVGEDCKEHPLNDDSLTDLLSPAGAALTDPTQVDRALAELWKPQPNKNNTTVATRICMANLLVIDHADNWPKLSEVLAELSTVFPTRTIVVLMENEQTGHTITATVSVICHLPQPSRPQVCCEQILLRCPPTATGQLDRTIIPLLAENVPLMVFWRIEPAGCSALFYRLQAHADRLILDTGFSGFKFLEPAGQCAVRELGWYRTAQRRELIANMFDGAHAQSLNWIEQISIRIEGASQEDWIDACWLSAFISGQLGWKPAKIIGPGRFELTSKTQTIGLQITAKPSGSGPMKSLNIKSCSESYVIQQLPEITNQYRIIIHNDKVCRLPRSIEVHRINTGRALPASFNDRQNDPVYNRAAPLAQWMTQNLTILWEKK
jgi:hypothetical protein